MSNILNAARSIPLWPDGCPHNDNPDELMAKALGRPAMHHYVAPERVKAKSPRAAVIICPGGGYGFRAHHEGEPFATLFNQHGIEAFVVDYRVKPWTFPAAYADVCRAIRLVRHHAQEWNIDPQHIGLMGFSAGGHLAASVATEPDRHLDEHDELAGQISARPDRLMLGYPVISADPTIYHRGSFRNLLGQDAFNSPQAETLLESMSCEKKVTAQTPPAFVFQTAADKAVAPQHSLRFALACAQAGVPCEYHQFEQGPHGVGMALTDPKLRPWTGLLITWLEEWVMTLN